MLDAAAERIAVAKQGFGIAEPAFAQRLADDGAAGAHIFDHYGRRVFGNHVAAAAQQFEIASAAGTEAEVVADEQVAGVQLLQQQMPYEILCRYAGQGLVEAQNPYGIEAAGVAQQA